MKSESWNTQQWVDIDLRKSGDWIESELNVDQKLSVNREWLERIRIVFEAWQTWDWIDYDTSVPWMWFENELEVSLEWLDIDSNIGRSKPKVSDWIRFMSRLSRKWPEIKLILNRERVDIESKWSRVWIENESRVTWEWVKDYTSGKNINWE